MGLDIIKAGKDLLQSAKGRIEEGVGDNLLGTLGNAAVSIMRPTGEPQRAYLWEVVVLGQGGEHVTHYAQSANLPTFSVTNMRRKYQGVNYNVPGQVTTPGVFRVTFWDDQNLTVHRFFMEWHRIMADASANRRVSPNLFKRGMRLDFRDTTDLLINQSFNFSGCYPMEVGGATVSYDSSDILNFDVEFAFDLATMGNGEGGFL